jgi:DNA invertase Pin-like site-specific DNA recombinase
VKQTEGREKEMKLINKLKSFNMLDIVILAMLEMEFTPTEIAKRMNISRQSIYNAQKKDIK